MTIKQGDKITIFYDDGNRVRKRFLTVLNQDENFMHATDGVSYNKHRIIRIEKGDTRDNERRITNSRSSTI